MRKAIKFPLFFLAAFLFTFLFTGCSGWQKLSGRETETYPETVSVILADAEGMTVKSENPVYVKSGESASFKVEINSGYRLNSISDQGVLENESIVIQNVRYPSTIRVGVEKPPAYRIVLHNDEKRGGLVCSERTTNAIMEGTAVTLRALPKEGQIFLGFSIGQDIANGGRMAPYSGEYQFSVHENTDIYANYMEEGSQVLCYHANEGVVSEGGGDILYSASKDSFYLCPNALPNKGQFLRDGYMISGYNTEPDGSGTYYGCGWNVPTEKNQVTDLYVQWEAVAAASEFTYTKQADQTIAITGWHGTKSRVVVPETIEGMPVTAILSNSFVNAGFQTLILPRTLLTAADAAIVGCPKFKELYFYDSIVSISRSFYQDCPQFQKLYVNAASYPKQNYERIGCYQIKYERLITAPGKKLVIIAGSSALYGFQSPMLEQQLALEYSVVNLGMNLELPAVFSAELTSDFVKNGDILLMAPENVPRQFGENRLLTRLWEFFESAYGAFSHIDIRNYPDLFDCYAENAKLRSLLEERSYESAALGELNSYGDLSYEREGYFQPTQYQYLTLSTDNVVPYAAELNRFLDLSIAKGAKTYTTFAPIIRACMHNSSLTREAENAYMNAIQNNIHTTVISDVDRYLLDSRYFYNGVMHLSSEGAELRTNMVAEDLKAQFKKEGR